MTSHCVTYKEPGLFCEEYCVPDTDNVWMHTIKIFGVVFEFLVMFDSTSRTYTVEGNKDMGKPNAVWIWVNEQVLFPHQVRQVCFDAIDAYLSGVVCRAVLGGAA